MTRIRPIFLLLLLFTLLQAGCDKIDAPYVKPVVAADTSACPVPQFPAVTSHVKRVLLEDYTGHNCPNCPSAARVAHELLALHGDKLILVTVHAGFFAKPSVSDPVWAYDFRTAAGTAWDSYFKISNVGNPNGMVDRKNVPAGPVISPAAWANAVKMALEETPKLDLQIITSFDEAQNKLCIHTKTGFIAPVSGRNLNICVLITEDSIVQPQKNSDPLAGVTPAINDFIHMNVLRGTANGTWGDPLLTADVVSGGPVVRSFRVNTKDFNMNTLKPENCHAVAFVYDAGTKEIWQSASVKIK